MLQAEGGENAETPIIVSQCPTPVRLGCYQVYIVYSEPGIKLHGFSYQVRNH